MTMYFVDETVEESGDGLTPETAFKTEDEACDIIERNAPQRVEVEFVLKETEFTTNCGMYPLRGMLCGTCGLCVARHCICYLPR